MTRIEELQRGIEAEATADFTALFCDGEVVDSGGDVTKSPGSKRKKKRKRQDGAEEGKSEVLQDPLEVFGSDMMMMILSYLDAPSVALSLLVSRGWHGVASSDRLWSTKCEELWCGKAHIPRVSQERGLSKLAAYSFSVMDGKRSRITKDDLCDHVWNFHFNRTIGEILILTGREPALPCVDTSIQMGAKLQILVTRYGVVMNAVTLSLPVLLVEERSGNTM
ncbi:uncharacterized protein LOC100251139 isoform X2 [Vitis vinifera]|uniref:uncharacterized protein LOC100251139 isoform X2 n=1 Tax=Vitis vinifera TaxID=29760 RepID=UPI002883361B|nr:uncharacterized protein LOC100251139 isoform X2 [Vitis vinifera]